MVNEANCGNVQACALVTKQPATQTVHTYPHSLAQSCYKDASVRHQEEIDASIRQDQKIILEMLEVVSDEDDLDLEQICSEDGSTA